MTALGEIMDDPREPKKKEKVELKFPRMSKEMNEFYELHSKPKAKKEYKPYVLEKSRSPLVSPKVDKYRLSKFNLATVSPTWK